MIDRELLIGRLFSVMEHTFPTELIFPSALHSLTQPYLTVFGNCIKKVSNQSNSNKKKKAKIYKGIVGSLLFFRFYDLSWNRKNNMDINIEQKKKETKYCQADKTSNISHHNKV